MRKRTELALDEFVLAQINAIPGHPVNTDPAWRTVMQWAKAWDLPKNTTINKCRAGLAAGLFEVEQRYAGEGCYVRKQAHYKFVGKSKR
jgi:hypothetical protein